MTANAFADIILAAIAMLAIAAFVSVLMIRDYALKYRQAMERGKIISKEITARLMVPIVGSHVKFQDEKGVERDAVVIAVHNPKMLTLAIVGNDGPDMVQFFKDIERGALVSHINLPPGYGLTYGYTEEELRSCGVPEKYDDLHHYSHVN
jgi:hypothetical protein